MRRPYPLILTLSLFPLFASASAAQQDPSLFQELRWRNIGPHRASRTKAASGVPSQPNVFYIGVVNGGVWKTTDYGRTWTPIFDDQPTGSIGAIAVAPSDPNIVYVGSGEGLQRPDLSTGDGIYRSTDAGKSWTHLGLRDGQQIPEIIVDPNNPSRLFVAVLGHPYGPNQERGVFRSLDGGQTFQKVLYKDENTGASDLAFDPRNPNTVYAVLWQARQGPWENGAWNGPGSGLYQSTDGGKTWTGFRGAPGGDDYQKGWINPDNGNIILLTSDQGAIITVNGGWSWSSWYNQPTAQFYHVAADNAFPYRLCSGQQESGSACISSRGDDGQITFREWHPVATEEYGYVAPDPLDPDIVYGGKVTRYDRRTGQAQFVGPKALRTPDYRTLRTAPLLFSPVDPHTLYFASNNLWKTTDGGNSWTQISPDLTRTDSVVPPNVGVYSNTPTARARHPGVIYTVAPSPRSLNTIWVGSDDGLIHVTQDGGKTWTNVTPPGLVPWAKVSIMDAGHSDTLTAYAAINTFRLDDSRPHIYRTHDGGKTWTHITNGIPDGGIVNVVREDPVRPGLLFAGTEQTVYVSFDDGDHWQTLRLNLPPTSIRDLIVKDDDIAVGTHGRSFWVLDDITPLRQLADSVARADAFLFRPQTAIRFRWNKNTDTPLPPDEPAGQNPPDGALIDYYLKTKPAQAVVLEVLDETGNVLRRFASDDRPVPPVEGRNVPDYWIRPERVLSAEPGMHRFVWDLRYPAPAGAGFSYSIAAIYQDTPREPRGPWVAPGSYQVRLTVAGRAYTQPLTVKMDPRVKTPPEGLAQQFALSMQVWDALQRDGIMLREARSVRAQLEELKPKAKGDVAAAIAALDAKAGVVAGSGGGFFGGGEGPETLSRLNGNLAQLLDMLQDADVAPSSVVVAAVSERIDVLGPLLTRWHDIATREVPALNRRLKAAGLAEVRLAKEITP
jgi:photosystem II stability/assembly factor-like uncharacterized protein